MNYINKNKEREVENAPKIIKEQAAEIERWEDGAKIAIERLTGHDNWEGLVCPEQLASMSKRFRERLKMLEDDFDEIEQERNVYKKCCEEHGIIPDEE